MLKMFSNKELLCSTVNIVVKCFDEAHLGPALSEKGRGKKQKHLPSVSLKSNRPNSAQRACSTGYPKLPTGPQPANHLLNSAKRKNAAQYRRTSEEGAIYIALCVRNACIKTCSLKMIMNKSDLSEKDQDEISMWLPVCFSTCRSQLLFRRYIWSFVLRSDLTKQREKQRAK